MKTTYDLIAYLNKHVIDWYKNGCRIYLDEYPEQEELRKEYFQDDPFIVSRFLIRK
jgi:hypothetical protein